MALVNITNIVFENPMTTFLAPIKVNITFEAL